MLTTTYETPRNVNGPQWFLVLSGVCLAGSSYTISSLEALRTLMIALIAVNTVLMLVLVFETVTTRTLGKLLIASGTLIFFWLEGLQVSITNPPFLIPEDLGYPTAQYSIDLVRTSLVYISGFQFALFAGYAMRPRLPLLIVWISSRLDRTETKAKVMWYLLASCAWVPIIATFGFGTTVILEKLVASRTDVGGTSVSEIGFLHYLTFFGMFGAGYLLSKGVLVSGKHRLLHLAAGAATATPLVMLSGTRHVWLFVALPVIVVGLSLSRGRLSKLKLLRLTFLVIASAFVMNLQVSLRAEGWDKIRDVDITRLTQGSSNGQYTALLHALYLVPRHHDYFLEPAEPYFLTHWIPRSLWGDKPVMRSWLYYNENYEKRGALNVTPSVIGQFHMNWGVLGVIGIGILLGFLAFVADCLILNVNVQTQLGVAVTIAALYSFIANSYRFYSPVYFTYFAFAACGMLLITKRWTAVNPPRMSHEIPVRQPRNLKSQYPPVI